MPKPLGPWPEEQDRIWQRNVWGESLRSQSGNFLISAAPATGKTRPALRMIHAALRTGSQRAVIVVPTTHLKKQWHDAAVKFGLQFDHTWKNNPYGPEPSDCHGMIVTYQTVAEKPHLHARFTDRPTHVTFDEIHHAGEGENLTWGDALRTAFDRARERRLLTGTSWRTDDNRIPYVTYDRDPASGLYRSRADFTYTYGDALADGVCRWVYFPSFEGSAQWRSTSGLVLHAELKEPMRDELAAERLRALLTPSGDWLPSIIEQANRKLSQMRVDNHPDAAGLIFAKDQFAAREIGRMVHKITGDEPLVAISDDPDAVGRLHAWGRGQGRWLVAVRIVSEGVDIPRLRIGIWATTTLTELFFRQALGRFLRLMPGIEPQEAFLYLPHVPILLDYAQRVKDERDHVLGLIGHAPDTSSGSVAGSGGTGISSMFAALDSSTAQASDVIYDHRRYTAEEISSAQHLRGLYTIPPTVTDALIVDIMRYGQTTPGTGAQTPAPDAAPGQSPNPETPQQEQKEKLRKKILPKLVARLYYGLGEAFTYKDINRFLSRETGEYVEGATLEQLQRRRDMIFSLLDDIDAARNRIESFLAEERGA